jgi:parallel beta-helix repeat protein
MTHVGARTESSAPSGGQRGRHIARLWQRRLVPLFVMTVVTAVLIGSVIYLGSESKGSVNYQPPGAAELGSISYPAPKNAIFVSLTGSDGAKGTKQKPLKSVQEAISTAKSGQTIVLRGGSYSQRVTITSDKTVTIQPYRDEIVWFDGTNVVTNWHQSGAMWTSDGWTTQFDSSPTYERGAPDNTEPGFAFINPDFPLAAHPDQIWIDGTEQTQVATSGEVVPGTFAVDYAASRLYLGSDPTGHEVRSSSKTKAFGIQSKNTVIRGIGIRRYGTPVSGFGAITVEAPGVKISNVLIEQNATTGLFIGAGNVSLSNLTVRDNGMIGVGANYADNLLVSGLVVTGNNTQHFNNAPVSGGVKITRSRNVTIQKSRFSGNFGPGLWFDQSDFNGNIISNQLSNNAGHGLILEISDRFVVAGNRVSSNLGNGIKINNTSNVQVWNNTLTNNARDLDLAQDSRKASDASVPGHDPRETTADPDMTWVIHAITVSNNIFSGTTADCLIGVEVFSGQYTADTLGITLDANAYQLANLEGSKWLFVWAGTQDDPQTYQTLDAFRGGTQQEKRGVELAVSDPTKQTWLNSETEKSAVARSVLEIPPPIRNLLGWNDVVRRMGVD